VLRTKSIRSYQLDAEGIRLELNRKKEASSRYSINNLFERLALSVLRIICGQPSGMTNQMDLDRLGNTY
jgi:hypothetical protein